MHPSLEELQTVPSCSTHSSGDCEEDAPRTQTPNEDGMKLYCLMRVDESTGQPKRMASLSEVQLVAQTLYKEGANSSFPYGKSASQSLSRNGSEADSGSPKLTAQSVKQGGPCQHCGTSASPQWRRGPPYKPVLCNACGIRYKRTNHLSSPPSPASVPSKESPLLPQKRCSSSRGSKFDRAPKLARIVSAQ